MKTDRTGYRFALALFYLGSAWAFAYYTVTAVPQSMAVVRRLVEGTAPLPHQFRVLGPWIIKHLIFSAHLSPHRAELIFYIAAYLGAVVALRRWLALFLPERIADLSPAWLFAVVVNQLIFHYPCDALTLLFMPLLLALAYERRWHLFLFAFVLACLNSGSAYLALLAAVAFEMGDSGKPRVSRGALAALVIGACAWAAVRALLFSAYGGNAGEPVSFKLVDNLRILAGAARPWDFENFPFLSSWGLPLVWFNILGWLNFAWILVFPRWRYKSPALKRLAAVALFQLAVIFAFANLWEKRAFLELVPMVLPLALQTFFPPGSRGDEPLRAPQYEPGRAVLAVFYMCMAWVMAYYTLASVPAAGAKLSSILAGHENLPFQYRILGPWTIYALSRTGVFNLNQAELLFYVASYLFAFIAMRLWLSHFLPRSMADLAPVWMVATVTNQLIYRYAWDPLTLGFIPLLLHLAYRRSWTWFLVVFAVGTFNRETTYLALIAALLFAPPGETVRDLKRIAPPLAVAALIWLAIKLLLAHAYAGNAGSVVEWKPYYNYLVLVGESSSWDFHNYEHLKGFKLPFLWLTFLSWANFWWVLLPAGWRRKSPVLKRLAWIILFQFALIFLVGNIWERRVYLELYPIVIALALQTFTEGRADEQE